MSGLEKYYLLAGNCKIRETGEIKDDRNKELRKTQTTTKTRSLLRHSFRYFRFVIISPTQLTAFFFSRQGLGVDEI